MAGRHDWVITRASMEYDTYVTYPMDDRYDMYRFRELRREQGREAALAEWAYFSKTHVWFVITRSICTDRTFERDEYDAVYVDHMDRFLHRAVR